MSVNEAQTERLIDELAMNTTALVELRALLTQLNERWAAMLPRRSGAIERLRRGS